ncbi:hypothetical protein LGK97_18510 [Clostridium sp. CS001]|uniref:hypothetical protein n=1 Tax=Clostridium sp. CS001 TaxID=2880648 RepID=UPI001CF342A2|nr:hypothetical protein [Clostridium sp. CS001]MCB2291708.1 hypothetical protein [Clostridium sp. CS001]
MSFGKAIIAFIIGIILSFGIGSLFSDSGVAVMTAVCYVGAIIVGLFYDQRK